MANEEKNKSKYEQIYREELDRVAGEHLWNGFKRALEYIGINGMPTGFLPYRAQKWIKQRVQSFSPRVASIASAAYLGVIGYYIFNLSTMNFSDVSSGSFFQTYSSTIYDFTLSSLLFKTVGGYLMLDTLRAPISYFRRPHGTLAAEGVGYLGKLLKKAESSNKEVKEIAEKNAKKRIGIMEILETDSEKRAAFAELNELQAELYAIRKSSPSEEPNVLKKDINDLRKRMGLEEIL